MILAIEKHPRASVEYHVRRDGTAGMPWIVWCVMPATVCGHPYQEMPVSYHRRAKRACAKARAEIIDSII